MRIAKPQDVDRWLSTFKRDAARYLTDNGMLRAALKDADSGAPMIVAILRAAERRTRRVTLKRMAALANDAKGRAAWATIQHVNRIRQAPEWQLLPLGFNLARLTAAHSWGDWQAEHESERQRNVSRRQCGKAKSPATKALAAMLELDDSMLTADMVADMARLQPIIRDGIQVSADGERVLFTNLTTKKSRSLTVESIAKSLRGLRAR